MLNIQTGRENITNIPIIKYLRYLLKNYSQLVVSHYWSLKITPWILIIQNSESWVFILLYILKCFIMYVCMYVCMYVDEALI